MAAARSRPLTCCRRAWPSWLIPLLAVLLPFTAFAQEPDPEPDIGPVIEGTATWDAELVRSYFKKTQDIDIGAATPDYPGRATLDTANSEFRRRVDAIMAVYQAHGGDGIMVVPRTGGLRSAQSQIDLYRQCREIITDANGNPIGDGTHASHYRVIPQERRTADNCPAGGPVTDVWVSWHNLGVAVDFGLHVNGRYDNGPLPTTTNPWTRMVQAAADLGMIWGGWFPWDPAHFEWHPEEDSPSGVDGAVSGTALTDDQAHAGYDWRLPTKLFIWQHSPDPKLDLLRVFDLNSDGNWAVVTKSRVIQGHGGDEWHGYWTTFDPPLKVFPLWIPTVNLLFNENAWPDDWQYRAQCQMRQDGDFNTLWSDGTPSRQVATWEGKLIYANLTEVRDRQKEAQTLIAQNRGHRARYSWLAGRSLYTVRVTCGAVHAGDASMQTVTKKGREVDYDGYTTDTESTFEGWLDPLVHMDFAWNRETGEVGVDPILVGQAEGREPYRLRTRLNIEGGAAVVVSGTLPDGAWDCPDPPQWPEQNERPTEGPRGRGGFLRP